MASVINEVINQQKSCHTRAFDMLSKALKLDESGLDEDKKQAIHLYECGITELEKGVQIDIKGQKDDRILRLKSKMETNLEMAKERLETLRNIADLQKMPIRELKSINSVLKPSITSQQASGTKYLIGNRTIISSAVSPSSSTNLSKAGISSSQKTISKDPTKAIISKSSIGNVKNVDPSTSAVNRNKIIPSTRTANRIPPTSKSKTTTTNFKSGVSGERSNSKNKAQVSNSETNQLASSAKRNIDVSTITGVDPKLASTIIDEIVDGGSLVTFDEIAGLQLAKQAMEEIVILPLLRPDLFTGLRSPCRGLLLFGPPGNGKTMLARAVATESSATFFNISASSLTSKYLGQSEKLVRALFAVARLPELQPSIIFVDEIDSLLSERREGEHEASRRLKTEFLCQFDGLHSVKDERILVMGATNRPHEIDEAVLRRFPKRIYVRLPDAQTRIVLLSKLLADHNTSLNDKQLKQLAELTEKYSSSDLTALAKDAALGPIRELGSDKIKQIKQFDKTQTIRPIELRDFMDSLKRVRHSLSLASLTSFEKWNREYGDVSL